MLAHTPETVLDSVMNVLAPKEPVTFSVSVQAATVIVAPTPSTTPPARIARPRVKRLRPPLTACLANPGYDVEVARNSQVPTAEDP